MDNTDLSRRKFNYAGTTSLLALLTGGVKPQQVDNPKQDYQFQSVAHLIGPASARPDPNDEFFDNKDQYAYLYEVTDPPRQYGAKYLISETDTTWTAIGVPEENNIVYVQDAAQLPAVENGRHQLKDATAYKFSGFVTSQYGLELAPTSPLLGTHGGLDGFIHTGGNTAIYGRNANYFSREMYVHAPSGTIYDLVATQSEEMLAESISASDAAGLGNIANLGTIDGYRVPSWKGCNFEDFDAGLTFTGTPDKVFISKSPLRGVTASNVTILTFDANFDADIVDLTNNYVKGVQSDTEVIRVDSSAVISDIFQYRGTTHDTTVSKSNILTGAADLEAVGYLVTDSYPLHDSVVVGELTLDSAETVTISNQNEWTDVHGTTSLSADTERMTSPHGGHLSYSGKRDTHGIASSNGSIDAPNDNIIEIAFSVNDVVEEETRTQIEGAGNTPKHFSISGSEQLVTDDYVHLVVRNTSSDSDVTFRLYSITYKG